MDGGGGKETEAGSPPLLLTPSGWRGVEADVEFVSTVCMRWGDTKTTCDSSPDDTAQSQGRCASGACSFAAGGSEAWGPGPGCLMLASINPCLARHSGACTVHGGQ